MLANPFLQNVVALLLTALLTGMLAPYILKRVDYDRALRQKEKDAELARQSKLIEAQTQLLEDMSRKLWRWRYLSMRVAYLGLDGPSEELTAAQKDYESQIWGVFSDVRSEISKTRRFVSDKAYHAALQLYQDKMVELDKEIKAAQAGETDANRAAAYAMLNEKIYGGITDGIDDVLHLLAVEARLAPEKNEG